MKATVVPTYGWTQRAGYWIAQQRVTSSSRRSAVTARSGCRRQILPLVAGISGLVGRKDANPAVTVCRKRPSLLKPLIGDASTWHLLLEAEPESVITFGSSEPLSSAFWCLELASASQVHYTLQLAAST